MRMNSAQAVWLGDKLCVGGGETSGSERDHARLYIYTPTTDMWGTMDTPVCWFTLTIYHSQLVLVGGLEYTCLLYTSPSPRDATLSRMPSSA